MKSSATIVAFLGLAAAGPIRPRLRPRQAVAPQATSFGPFTFTSTFNMIATPDQVINGTTVTPGEAGSMGFYNYGINSELDIICYNITLMGVTGPFSSPAVTATHIHEAALGASGPPRIAFPNPEPADSGPEVVKRSAGCIQGPFSTGILAEGTNTDTGAGFTLAQIEANPAGFFTDSHTALSVPGVVRAQLAANPVGAAPGEAPAAAVLPPPGQLQPLEGAAVPAAGTVPAAGQLQPLEGASVAATSLQPLEGASVPSGGVGVQLQPLPVQSVDLGGQFGDCTVVSAGPPVTVVCVN